VLPGRSASSRICASIYVKGISSSGGKRWEGLRQDGHLVRSITTGTKLVISSPRVSQQHEHAWVGAFESRLFDQKRGNDPVDDLQHGGQQMGMCGKQQAQRDRKRQHPLAHRHPGDDVIARRAAVSTMRRAPQPGQKPRRLQLKATSFSWAQSAQRRRRKPRAKMPQSRKASNSSLTNSGNPAPVSSSTWARKVSRCS
jgi:hypothetical protein